MPQRPPCAEGSGWLRLELPSPLGLLQGSDGSITCERTPFPVAQDGIVARLHNHASPGVCRCPSHGGTAEDVSLVPIAAVLDERRLSAMAVHPSALKSRRSAEPVQNSVSTEELAE